MSGEAGEESADRVCRRYIFHGRVQGVGFRWTTSRIAGRHPVAGYVKNLRDGTVELVAQAAATDVARFVTEVRENFRRSITNYEEENLSPDESLHGFSIQS